jgi:hypothetical protein
LSSDLSDKKELAMGKSGGREFKAKASAKVLR